MENGRKEKNYETHPANPFNGIFFRDFCFPFKDIVKETRIQMKTKNR